MPTPLPVAAGFLLARAQRRRRELADTAARVRAQAPGIARALRDRLGVSRVVLFGSAARGELHESSDVDIAVWGLPDGAEAEAEDIVREHLGLRADIVRMEAAPQRLRARVKADGVEVDPAR
jgi:predicted nucleotidyltransferase